MCKIIVQRTGVFVATYPFIQKKKGKRYVVHDTPWRIGLPDVCKKLGVSRAQLKNIINNGGIFLST